MVQCEDWDVLEIDERLSGDIATNIINSVPANINVVKKLRNVSGSHGAIRWWRVEFQFAALTWGLFDAFANSRSGYRGHYYSSQKCGDAYNQLIAFGVSDALEEVREGSILRSVRHGKLWPVEGSQVVKPEVNKNWGIDRWSDNIDRFHKLVSDGNFGVDLCQWMDCCFDWSIKDLGPYRFDKNIIEFKGGWVNDLNEEVWVSESKRFRSLQIHCFGAS